MNNLKLLSLACLGIVVMLASFTATAIPINFQGLPTGDPFNSTQSQITALEAQLSAEMTAGGLGVQFTFFNDVGLASSITDIYFDDPTGILNMTVDPTWTESTGVSFDSPATPPSIPGNYTVVFSADSNQPIVENGINSSGEYLTVTFALDGTFTDLQDALLADIFHIGIHVQGIGGNDGTSDWFIAPSIPEPGTILLGLAGLVGLACSRRFCRFSSPQSK